MSETDLFGLKDVHAVITGASGGIGLETVRLFTNLGARITAHYHLRSGTLKDYPHVNPVRADATDEGEVENLYRNAIEENGTPEVLVGNLLFRRAERKFVTESLNQRNTTLQKCLWSNFGGRLMSI